jgi:hypothetical protein
MTPRRALSDMSDHHDREDNAEPTEAAEPIDRIEAMEPALPIDRTEPTLAMDRIEPFDPIDRKELSDQSDQREVGRLGVDMATSCPGWLERSICRSPAARPWSAQRGSQYPRSRPALCGGLPPLDHKRQGANGAGPSGRRSIDRTRSLRADLTPLATTSRAGRQHARRSATCNCSRQLTRRTLAGA